MRVFIRMSTGLEHEMCGDDGVMKGDVMTHAVKRFSQHGRATTVKTDNRTRDLAHRRRSTSCSVLPVTASSSRRLVQNWSCKCAHDLEPVLPIARFSWPAARRVISRYPAPSDVRSPRHARCSSSQLLNCPCTIALLGCTLPMHVLCRNMYRNASIFCY